MKRILFRSAFMLAMFIGFVGCSDDNESQCPEVACLNGGTFKDCGCSCPEGYSGANCETVLAPTSIRITKIRVTMFPNEDGSGDIWDFNSAADIKVALFRYNNPNLTTIYNSSTYYPDVISTGSNYFDFIPESPISINQINTSHVLALYDQDSPDDDDLISVIEFMPFSSSAGFPTTLSITDNESPIPFRAELTLQYQW